MRILKHSWPYVAGIILGLILIFTSCTSVKKTFSASSSNLDSIHTDRTLHTTASQVDSNAQSSEKGDYVRQTVIEEFQGDDNGGDEHLADTIAGPGEKYSAKEPENVPAPGKLIKKTTITESGNYLKQQSVDLKTKDTTTKEADHATELKKDDASSSRVVEKHNFPTSIVIGGFLLIIIAAVVYYLKRKGII